MLSNLLLSEPTGKWSYKAEGNANVVFSYMGNASALVGKVLKVRKLNAKARSRLSPEFQLLPHDPLDFAENIMSPLLGQSYSSVGERVFVDSQFLHELNESLKETPLRSFSRKEQDIDVMFPYVIIMKDRTLLTKTRPKNTYAEGKDVISFGVEIKPKCGNLPCMDEVSLPRYEQQNDSKSQLQASEQTEPSCTSLFHYSCSNIANEEVLFKCRFCMQQVQKSLRYRQESQDACDYQGDDPTPVSVEVAAPFESLAHYPDYSPSSTSTPCSSLCSSYCALCDVSSLDQLFPPPESLSQYCPLDLFSLDYARMLKAVSGLFLTPQNNFRVFLNHYRGALGVVKKATPRSYFPMVRSPSKSSDTPMKGLYERGQTPHAANLQHGASGLLNPVLEKLAQLPLFETLRELDNLHRANHQADCLLGWLQITSKSCTVKIPFPHTEALFSLHPPAIIDSDGVTTRLVWSWFQSLSVPNNADINTDSDSDDVHSTHTILTGSAPSELLTLLFLITNALRSGPVLSRIRSIQALDRGLLGGIGRGGPHEAALAIERVASIMQSIIPSFSRQPLSLSDHISFLEIEAVLSYILHSKEASFDVAGEFSNEESQTECSFRLTCSSSRYNPNSDAESTTRTRRLESTPAFERISNESFARVLMDSLRQWRRRLGSMCNSPVAGSSPRSPLKECDLPPNWLEKLQKKLEKHCSKDEIQNLQIIALSLISFMISATAKDCSILIALEGTSTAPNREASQIYQSGVPDKPSVPSRHRSPPTSAKRPQTLRPLGAYSSCDEQQSPRHEEKHDLSESCTISFVPSLTSFPNPIISDAQLSIANSSPSPKPNAVLPSQFAPIEAACLSSRFAESSCNHIRALCSSSVDFQFSIGVVDLDPKPLHRIPKYKAQDDTIRSLWANAVKQWTANSEPELH